RERKRQLVGRQEIVGERLLHVAPWRVAHELLVDRPEPGAVVQGGELVAADLVAVDAGRLSAGRRHGGESRPARERRQGEPGAGERGAGKERASRDLWHGSSSLYVVLRILCDNQALRGSVTYK